MIRRLRSARPTRWAAALGVAGLGVAGLAACGGGGTSEPGLPDDPAAARHVLQRTGYGADAWSRARIEELGVEGYLEEQLAPASIDDSALAARLAAYPTLSMSYPELAVAYEAMPAVPIQELVAAKVVRSVASRRQLEQVLVDFWFDHFNVFGADGPVLFAVGPYERDAIRPHVLGRFEDMLLAVSRHAAMLFYLDNYLSSREGYVDGEGVTRGLNENFARELLELHTVGVDGGYTQQDVVDVARAFTGWAISPPPFASEDGFFFLAGAHDEDAKQVMELYLPPGRGMGDGLDVVEYLATHPRTARFLCGKLVQRFVSEERPEGAVADCAQAYLDGGGDLEVVMRTLLFSREFFDAAHRGAKVKRPLHFMASVVRATGLPLDPSVVEGVAGYLSLLGEPLYLARPPTGHPDESVAWASGGAVVSRFNLSELLSAPDVAPGIDWGATGGSDAEVVDGVADRLLPGGLSDATRDLLIDHLETAGLADPQRIWEAGALVLASPDFQRH